MAKNAKDARRRETPAATDTTADDLAKALEFLNLTGEDAVRLRQLSNAFLKHSDEFVEGFYRHLFRFEEAARLLQDEQLVARLKQAQLTHFEEMLTAEWDENFAEKRHRVGQAHADLGVEPRLFLGAYGQYLEHCFSHFAAVHRQDHDACVSTMLSLWKAILLDIGLSLDAYFARTTQDLQQALEMYWTANTELRHFAELTSHDLKTPLATVANLCDEVLDEFGEQIPAEAREMLSAARSRTFRMSTMIDELLEASSVRLDTSGNDEVSTKNVVREALERVQPMIDEKGIELKIAENLPYVVGNPVKLREAIYNVLSNAAKFVSASTGRIDIDAKTSDAEVVLSVADNGPGIPADEVKRVFMPFHRLARHRDMPGSGLGLYFTKMLVEQQKGRIWVESTLDQGCTFFIALRCPESDSDNDLPDDDRAK